MERVERGGGTRLEGPEGGGGWGGEKGSREGRGCPLPAKMPRAAAGGGEVVRDGFAESLQ